MKFNNKKIPAELAPCGVFCGACPSLGKSCLGCASDDKRQNLKKLTELGIEEYLKYQNKRWECPSCKGKIHWYYYRCNQCNQNFLNRKEFSS